MSNPAPLPAGRRLAVVAESLYLAKAMAGREYVHPWIGARGG